jgi:S1-C subfamily serine protease
LDPDAGATPGRTPGEAGAAPGRTPGDAGAARSYTGIKLFEMGLRHSAAYIDRVAPGSPAAAAGLRPDDLILAVDGAKIGSAREFRRRMERQPPGRRAALTIKRGDEVRVVDLTPGAAPEKTPGEPP